MNNSQTLSKSYGIKTQNYNLQLHNVKLKPVTSAGRSLGFFCHITHFQLNTERLNT